MGYADAATIMQVAREVKELAIKRRRDELGWAAKGVYPDSDIENQRVPGGITGGTSDDYAALETGYEWIVQAFQNSIGPEPSGLDGLIASFDAAQEKLRGGAPGMLFATATDPDGTIKLNETKASNDSTGLSAQANNATANLSRWHGEGAMAFKNHYLSRFPVVTTNQALVAMALRSAVDCNRSLYVNARNELLRLAKATKVALDYHDPCDSVDVSLTLSVVAGVTGVIAAGASGPGAIIAFTAVSSGAGVFKDVLDQDKDKAGTKAEGKEYKVNYDASSHDVYVSYA